MNTEPHPSTKRSRGVRRRWRQPSPAAAFTLLELLVAILILVAVVGLMGSTFNQTQRTWLFTSEKLDAEMAGRALLQQIATELSQAIATNGMALNYSGNALSFFATITPGSTNALCELRKIEYRLTAAGSSGLQGLERKELLCGSSSWPSGSYDAAATVAADQIHDLSFQFASVAGPFGPDWNRPELPAAVRIRIVLVGTRTAARLVAMGGNDRLRDEYLVTLSTIATCRNAPLTP